MTSKSSLTRFAGLALTLVAAKIWLSLFLDFDWGHGKARGLILCGVLFGLIILRVRPRPASETTFYAKSPLWIGILLILALAADLGDAGQTTLRSVQTHRIPMDQGQATWRAARLLWRGEDPYGMGEVIDNPTFLGRLAGRNDVGMAPALSGPALYAALLRYDKTLDPALRRQILPIPAEDQLTGAAAREARLLGYKYGPILVILTAPFALFDLPAVVVMLNSAACLGLFVVIWRLLRELTGTFAALGMVALLLDRFITSNYLENTATDVWALLFCALAVHGYVARRPMMTATALALAAGSKIFPTLTLLPLLLHFRSARPIALFAGLTIAIYLPWLLWDPAGLVDNLFLWPLLMADNTSWLYYVDPPVVWAVRVIAFLAAVALWVRFLTGRETRIFWTLVH
jgi:Glycosyltransferase family 87